MKCVVNEHCNPFSEIAVTVKRFRRVLGHGYMETLIKQAKSNSASLTLITILTLYFRMKIMTGLKFARIVAHNNLTKSPTC